jgi:hypothetical protein
MQTSSPTSIFDYSSLLFEMPDHTCGDQIQDHRIFTELSSGQVNYVQKKSSRMLRRHREHAVVNQTGEEQWIELPFADS